MPSIKEISSSTQLFTEIYDVAENMVMLSSGTISIVLEIGTMNFGLLSEEEQDTAIYAYAALLNSLNFPLQIVIWSQTKDVTNYLANLEIAEQNTVSPVKRDQIRRYREFVSDLVHEGNVLDKKFFAVISASTIDLGIITPKTFMPGQPGLDLSRMDRSEMFEQAAHYLDPKRDQLIAAFARLGLQARALVTQELVKLYYTNYNFADSEGIEVGNTADYTTPIVTAEVAG